MSKLTKEEMREFLLDKLKDFTVRQMEQHGDWLRGHIHRFVIQYDHIRVGNTVTQTLTDENGFALEDEVPVDVEVEAIEIALPTIEGDGGIMVFVDGPNSPEYYYNLREVEKVL